MNPKRKKQPEAVKAKVLQAAAQVAAETGLDSVTIAKVTKLAGITTGGLFHHFPSKQNLLDNLVDLITENYQKYVEESIAQDPDSRGKFTRAYLKSIFDYNDHLITKDQFCVLLVNIVRNKERCLKWVNWVESQLKIHREDNDPVLGQIIRFAADGLWLERYSSITRDESELKQIVDKLIELTKTV